MMPMLALTWWGLPLVGLGEWALPGPASAAAATAFVVSALLTLLLSTAFTMILHVALIWTISGEGINRMMPGVVPLLAGLVVPLPLFPDWLQGVLYWQPFRGMADVPFRIYSGHIAGSDVLVELVVQVAWFALLVAFGYALLRRARHRLVVQGG
jgi:ABC-2 type transport system permease protein